MNIKLNLTLREFIDSNRGEDCRARYILKCVSYIRDNNIDLNEYYEGIDNDRVEELKFRREG